MRNFLIFLIIVALLSGVAFFAYKSLIIVPQNSMVVVADNFGQILVASPPQKYLFYPRAVLVGHVFTTVVPQAAQSFSTQFVIEIKFFDKAWEDEQKNIVLHFIGKYKIKSDNMDSIIANYGFSFDQIPNKIAEDLQYFWQQKISALLADERQMQQFSENAQPQLRQLLASWQTKQQQRGIFIDEIFLGPESNFFEFLQYWSQIYQSDEILALRKQKAADLLAIDQQQQQQQIRLQSELKMQQLQNQSRLQEIKEYAQLIRNFPEAYKYLFLEKIGDNTKIIISDKEALNSMDTRVPNGPAQDNPEQIEPNSNSKNEQGNLPAGEFLQNR